MTHHAAPASLSTPRRRLAALLPLATALALPPLAAAQGKFAPATPGAQTRAAHQIPVNLDHVPRLVVTLKGRILLDETGFYGVDRPLPTTPADPTGGLRGPGCPITTSSHTDSSFESVNGNAQGGFAQNEIAAASYPVAPAAFPIKFESAEAIFVTSNATQVTTTQWSIILYDGPPNTGVIAYQESSLDGILPPIILGPGTAGVNVQVVIDPEDPEQVFFFNDAGTSTISVGYRIDQHHNQTANPCFTAPPSCCNAFPVTDSSGLSQPQRNWLNAVNCGPLGCPPNGGWTTLGNLISACRPTGDWIMRMRWSSVNCTPGQGACCLPSGVCQINSQANCTAAGGVYQGDSTTCGTINCPPPTGACCFGTNCLNLTQADCTAAAGTWLGAGTACASGNTCPTGACCLPDGTCEIRSQAACTAAGGLFRGVGTACATANCPQPSGACCLSSGGCLLLTQADCAIIPGSAWAGPGTNCADGNGDGVADACAGCAADWNDDTLVNSNDISAYLTDWLADVQNGTTIADFDTSGQTNSNDISAFLTAWLDAVQNGC